ncbi:MAG: hypothetical protein JWQ01_4430 [Massilia sp.]|nr:hypothetical protein [Massilia sp.]
MISIFKRAERAVPVDTSALGLGLVAMPLPAGCAVPTGCGAVVVDRGGRTRRAIEGSRLALAAGETAYAFHPGPYAANLLPFAAAPELGLRVSFAVDSPDPRVAQQRFDLFLASEADGALSLADLGKSIETALQRELAQGNLDLPPCTSLAEWNLFRAGFNQLLYMRFGLTVEECVPVDLGDLVDFAQLLVARPPAPAAAQAPAAVSEPMSDARALRRLFLELPCVMCAFRLAVLPQGQQLFRRHQDLLQRLDLVSLSVATMPALELAAPGVLLEPAQQAHRITHSRRAVEALDEAWALLARVQVAEAAHLESLFDEAERIVANLEHDTAKRRLAQLEGECA